MAVALKKYLDERGGKITDPAGAYNYLEHHMVKNALPHFSQTHENARKNQTPISGPTLELVRRKQAILKALAMAHGTKKLLERCRFTAEAREMQRQVKNAERCERRTAAETLAEKAEIAAAKGDTRQLFRLTRKMAPPQRLPTQTVRQCCPKTGAPGERCWTQDEELDARTHALEFFFEGTAGESPEITVDDPKEQITATTEISAGPFAAVDFVRAVKGLPNGKAGPNIVKNEGERLASGATAVVWKFYLPVITAFCAKVWNASWQMKPTSPALKTSEIAFLAKAKKDAADPLNSWRTISLLAHGGKAMMRCIWRQILPNVAPKISEAQFGGVPGRGTREAVLVATGIIARFHKATKGPGKSRSPPMYLAAVLFDLEKAFDKVDRSTAFATLAAKAQMAGLDMYLEEMHNGTYYKIRDRSSRRGCARARWRDR